MYLCSRNYTYLYIMEKPQSRFMSVHYQLYTVDGEERNLQEQTSRERPFEFISGFGIALDALERRLVDLEAGTPFDIVLPPEEAFGLYEPQGVHKLEREVFSMNGHFDHENIYPGAVITLVDEDDHRFMARIVEVSADGVTIDTNHPLAGKTLNFTGLLLQNRDATLEEIQAVLNKMSGEGCGCGCEDCGHDHGGCGHCHH